MNRRIDGSLGLQEWQPGASPYKGLHRFQIRIFLRDLAKVRVHLEAGFEMPPCVPRATEERFVTTKIVVENRLPPQSWRTF